MAHQRKLIRDAVILALTGSTAPTYPTAAGARIFNNRVALWPTRLLEQGPCISLYAIDEKTKDESKNTAPRKLKRDLNLGVEALIQASPSGDVDDQIDALCVQIEREMHRDPTFGGVCVDSILSGTDIEVSAEGKTEIGNVRLTYLVTYHTLAPDPADVTLDNFNSAQVRTNLANEVDPDEEAEDEIDLVYALRSDLLEEDPTFDTARFDKDVAAIFFWLNVNVLPPAPLDWELKIMSPAEAEHLTATGTLEAEDQVILELPVAGALATGAWRADLFVGGILKKSHRFTITE